MIRVLLADDQALVRDGFRALIDREDDMTVIAEAGDGAEAVRLAELERPDVILMDIRMPVMDGLEATRRIAAGPVVDTKVLVLTTFDQDDYLYQTLKAGASGYLLKDVRKDQLIGAIRTVAAGDSLLAPSVTRRLIEDFCRRPPPRTSTLPAPLDRLTERELQILTLLAQGLSNAEIGAQLFLGESTVKTHLAGVSWLVRSWVVNVQVRAGFRGCWVYYPGHRLGA
jgi:DNA-binding NarL/FixJ family response regulator